MGILGDDVLRGGVHAAYYMLFARDVCTSYSSQKGLLVS